MNPPIIRTKDLIADTLELMAIIDRTEEFGGCYLWSGRTSSSGSCPMLGRRVVRRIVWEANHGPIPEGMLVTPTCQHSQCVSCLKLATKKDVLSRTMKNPVANRKWRAAIARTVRAKKGKINMEIARSIRASDKTGEELAAEHDIDDSLVSKIRHNLAWVEYTANPFAGLMT